MKCHVKLLHEDAIVPTRGSAGAAGFDLYSVHTVTIPPGDARIIDTGVAIELDAIELDAIDLNTNEGFYARVAPRSGLAVRYGLDVLAGVVDSDYRDSIKVVIVNHGKGAYQVNKGDRIAQLIFEKIMIPEMQKVEELSQTVRGTGGFGSTGV